jgi:hypothetical protein
MPCLPQFLERLIEVAGLDRKGRGSSSLVVPRVSGESSLRMFRSEQAAWRRTRTPRALDVGSSTKGAAGRLFQAEVGSE